MLPGTRTSSKRTHLGVGLITVTLIVVGVATREQAHDRPTDRDEPAFTSASCDEHNHAVDVDPDTEQARTDATDWCTRMGAAIDNAPWPSGLHPVPLPPSVVGER